MQQHCAGTDARHLADMIVRNSRRGAELVRQMLSFARGAEAEHVPLDPAAVVDELANMLQRTLPRSMKLEVARPDRLWHIAGNATQLHQVLMNLCVNARDAMRGSGTLRIDVSDVELTAGEARKQIEARAGRYVRLCVGDTGPGMSPEVVEKIFDPFFTTKALGEGTGLGLSTVRGIVLGHAGFITVDSILGQGTTFSVYLPALDDVDLQPAAAADEPARVRGHGERILLIDDEGEVREAVGGVLESAGYQVVSAEDGSQGVRLFRNDAAGIQAVVTDMVMPGMNGVETIARLREVDPHVRVIATSGVLDRGEAAASGALAFVPKPVELDQLLRVVADTLAQAA